LAQNRIGNCDFQNITAILFAGCDLRLVLRFKADELDILLCRLAVIVFFKAIGSHVPEEDMDIHFGIEFSELQGVLDGLAATDTAAVILVFLTTADTLDHHQALGAGHFFVAVCDLAFQLKLGDNPIVLTIKVFGRLMFLGTGRKDGDPVRNLLNLPFSTDGRDEVSDITRNIRDRGIM